MEVEIEMRINSNNNINDINDINNANDDNSNKNQAERMKNARWVRKSCEKVQTRARWAKLRKNAKLAEQGNGVHGDMGTWGHGEL